MPSILSKPGVQYLALLRGSPAYSLIVERVQQSCGSRHLDSATLRFDLGRTQARRNNLRGQNLADLALNALNLSDDDGPLMFATCAVQQITGNNGAGRFVHVGEIDFSSITQSDRGQSVLITSRLEPYHFGRHVGFQRVINPIDGTVASIHDPCIFNPNIDGKTFGNRRTPADNPAAAAASPLFVHTESIRSAAAAKYQSLRELRLRDQDGEPLPEGDSFELWDLPSAVKYLCNACNPGESMLVNPNDMALLILEDAKAVVRHRVIPHDVYLPEALDILLEPYGFTWAVKVLSPLRFTLEFFRRGQGIVAAPSIQRPGSQLDINLSDAEEYDLTFDAATLANFVQLLGAKMQIEATFPLVPAWRSALDNTDLLRLSRASPTWNADVDLHRVGRDYILNEAGDAIGTRDGITAPFDLTTLFQAAIPFHPPVIPHRRRFLPLLTVRTKMEGGNELDNGGQNTAIGTVHGCTVQYLDNFTSPPEWKNIPTGDANWQCELLENECGVRFTGEMPPFLLWQQVVAGSIPQLRIVATIESDSRLAYNTGNDRAANSLNPNIVTLRLDCDQSFQRRRLLRTGPYKSIYADPKYSALEADGLFQMAELAHLLRASYDRAQLDGSITIFGLDRPYALGWIVQVIAGVAIDLTPTSAAADNYYWPQIMAITHLPQTQRMQLQLETFAPTRAMIDAQLVAGRRWNNATRRRLSRSS